jgi:hypothetical protein
MQWTTTDAVRRWLVVCGLILGSVMAVVSSLIGLTTPPADSMRESFDVMATRGDASVAQTILETVGFTLVIAALIGATQALRARGGGLGTAGAVLGFAGIAGFGLSNGAGPAVAALAQLPDPDTTYRIATAISSDGPIAVLGNLGWMLEIAGQLGLLLVLAGLWRARILPPWPLALGVLGLVVNAVIGTMVTTLIADLLLLVAMIWVAIRLARTSHEAWLGASSAARLPEPVAT